ncbi:MAG: tetratricopeptide repeat protein [Steroidobacteraceae bacterium]
MSDDATGALSLSAVVERAHFLIDRQRFDQARTIIGEGLASDPDSDQLLYLSAFVDWAEDRLDSAHTTLRQLLATEPEHYGGRVLLARLLKERKDFQGAEKLWIALLKEYPEDADLHAGYGELMLEVLEVDKGRRLAEEGLRHEPEHEHCLYVVAMARLIDGESLGHNTELATLVSSHPEHLRAGTTLVIALQERGRTREALRISQELLRAQPSHPQLLQNVKALKVATHWSLLPLYPIQRWGWPAVFALWAIFAFGLPRIAPGLPPNIATGVTVLWIAYVIYSWVWPPILRKMI